MSRLRQAAWGWLLFALQSEDRVPIRDLSRHVRSGGILPPELAGYTFVKVLTCFAMVSGSQGRARFQTIPLRSVGALASASRAGLKSLERPLFL